MLMRSVSCFNGSEGFDMKMDWKYFIIILLSYLTITQAEEHLTCIEDNPRTRSFQSLVEYQANKLSFNPYDANYKGNYVRFNFDIVNQLQKNSFITFSSKNVIGLELSNKNIKTIDEGAFLYLPCLRHLDLSNNKISNLTRDMFLGLENLKFLNISGNKINYVYDNVFSTLKSIQELNLASNNISGFSKLALSNITTLKTLTLSYNCIKRMCIYFSQLPNLEELYLDHNEIAFLPTAIFSKNMFLEKLDLSGNGLVVLDMRNDHSELRSIKYLNLSDNYLITLSVGNITSHFPNEDLTVDFNNNQFYCSNWTTYLKEFKEKHVKIAPGRNFSQEYYIDGIACDTLNFTLNGSDSEEEDMYAMNAKLGEDTKRYGAQSNNTFDYILRELNHRDGELSAKRAKYKNVGVAPDKSLLVEHSNVTEPSKIAVGTNEPDGHITKPIFIGLAVIGTAFLILVILDYVLGIGYTKRMTRRLRRYLASASNDDTADYVTLTPPT